MNLYYDDLDQLTFEAVENFVAVGEPSAPLEGARLDYKVEANAQVAETASAFSNTDGGLILIGVVDEKGVPIKVPGFSLPRRGEPKTHVGNLLADCVRPRLEYDIGVTKSPSGTYLAVVRVEPGAHPPYMFVRGGANRVLVRTHDSDRKADIRQLEDLFARPSALDALAGKSRPQARFAKLEADNTG